MSNKHLYARYYGSQVGSGIAPYAGLSRVSGHGFGSMLANVWRFLSPIIAPSLQIIKKEAVDSGLKILHDLSANRPLKTSVKKHLSNAGKNVIETSLKRLQGGRTCGNIRRKNVKKKQSRPKPRKDIFS
jgi:hypothetical protein